MGKLCTDNWDENCDTYLGLTTPENAKALVKKKVATYLEKNGVFTKDPNAEKVIRLCRMYPGVCDEILANKCSAVKRSDLLKDLDSNVYKICGCHLAPDNYAPYDTLGDVECDPACVLPGTIQKGISGKKCLNTNCIINDSLIQQLQADVGHVDIQQMCKGCTRGKCVCHFPDIDIETINSRIKGGVTLKRICDVCISRGDDEASPKIVPCDKKMTESDVYSADVKESQVSINFPIISSVVIAITIILILIHRRCQVKN
jgi:hypothetical protein